MKITFADTYYYLALLNPRDAAHSRAVTASQGLSGRLITTHWVLTEVADAFAAPDDRDKFLALLTALQVDPSVLVVPADQPLFDRGVDFYRRRPDKDWPLTDCLSFVVMQDNRIQDALTGDLHFKQAGFNTLLADEERLGT
jgi:predicted nucleic acid-binding protein